MIQLKVDKEFQKLIPPLQSTEYSQLAENIIENGCQDAIKAWDGTIIDGHNRHKICTEHNIPFQVQDMEFDDRDAATIWIIKNQFGRRNLLPFQRSELALKMKPLVKEKAAQNKAANGGDKKSELQKSETPVNKIHTDDEISKLAGVSRDTISKSEKIIHEGTEEQRDRARSGGKGNTVNAIYGEIIKSQVSEKACASCKKTLPIDRFNPGRNQCKTCIQQARDSGGVSKKELIKTIIAGSEKARNLDRKIEYTVDNFMEELSCINTDYLQKVRRMLDIHYGITQIPENRQKAIAALSEAETAIRKIKELLK